MVAEAKTRLLKGIRVLSRGGRDNKASRETGAANGARMRTLMTLLLCRAGRRLFEKGLRREATTGDETTLPLSNVPASKP